MVNATGKTKARHAWVVGLAGLLWIAPTLTGCGYNDVIVRHEGVSSRPDFPRAPMTRTSYRIAS
jgi:hypothetical protein